MATPGQPMGLGGSLLMRSFLWEEREKKISLAMFILMMKTSLLSTVVLESTCCGSPCMNWVIV